MDKESVFWESFVFPILKYKKLTYIIVGSALLGMLVFCLIIKNKYTSTATILPSGSNSLSSDLKDLAVGSLSDLGLGASTQAPENSSALFPDILASRLISEKILQRSYSFSHDSRPESMTLYEYIDLPNLDKAIKKLNKLVSIYTDKRTGVITLSVTTEYPELSAEVVHAYLEELDEYNIHHRQSTGSENEKFTSRRMAEIKIELESAEDTLRAFKESNMNYMTSSDPELQVELTRLQREVDLKSSLYLTMSQQYELARVEAVKDIPVVQVLDEGAVPLIKSWPRRSIFLAYALFGSLFLSILLSLWLDLSIKRGINRDLKRVISYPSIHMNRFESKIANRITRLADLVESKETNSEEMMIQK
jgi:uncharacterized protein involved in exopolysaccharide biosynthesis